MSGNLAQSLGIVTVSWGGMKFSPDSKSASFSPGGLIGKAVVAGNQITTAYEMQPAMVKFAVTLKPGMSIASIRALNGKQLIVGCDTGQSYVVNGAFHTKDPSAKAGAGANLSLEVAGQPAAEVLS